MYQLSDEQKLSTYEVIHTMKLREQTDKSLQILVHIHDNC